MDCRRKRMAALEIVDSSAEGPAEIKDLLPWPIQTGKRGSRLSRALVAVEPGEPPLPDRIRMQLAIADFMPWEMADLPLKKRILIVAKGRDQNQHTCIICGRVFNDYCALGGHMAHHTKRSRRATEEKDDEEWYSGPGELVLYGEPPLPQLCLGRIHECLRCGRTFSSGQGLGGHKRHCKGPPVALVETDGGAIDRYFDLNELPQPDEILALPWYGHDESGVTEV